MLQEKYSQNNKKFYHVFVDLEKAFDRVPRRAIEWTLGRKGITERMVVRQLVMAMYVNSRTRVKAMAGKQWQEYQRSLTS